jgi:hypothetical protein
MFGNKDSIDMYVPERRKMIAVQYPGSIIIEFIGYHMDIKCFYMYGSPLIFIVFSCSRFQLFIQVIASISGMNRCDMNCFGEMMGQKIAYNRRQLPKHGGGIKYKQEICGCMPHH